LGWLTPSTIKMDIKLNSKKHDILYGIAKRTLQKKKLGWIGTACKVKELQKTIGPLQYYQKQTILGDINWLIKKDYVEKLKINNQNIGYCLTEKGINFIESNKIPKSYDH